MGEKTCARLLSLLVRAEGVAEKDKKWAPWIRECGVRRRPKQARGGSTFPRLGDRSGKGHAPRLISS